MVCESEVNKAGEGILYTDIRMRECEWNVFSTEYEWRALYLLNRESRTRF